MCCHVCSCARATVVRVALELDSGSGPRKEIAFSGAPWRAIADRQGKAAEMSLSVLVKSASALPNVERFSKSDPMCVITLEGRMALPASCLH